MGGWNGGRIDLCTCVCLYGVWGEVVRGSRVRVLGWCWCQCLVVVDGMYHRMEAGWGLVDFLLYCAGELTSTVGGVEAGVEVPQPRTQYYGTTVVCCPPVHQRPVSSVELSKGPLIEGSVAVGGVPRLSQVWK